jgi:dTDP-glucose 4,6-dehydratase
MIQNSLLQKALPVYGKGANVRDWLFVEDHAEAIWMILKEGKKGEIYDIGGKTELSNLELLHLLIELLEKKRPGDYRSLIRFVQDRPGHDFRYALDSSKIEEELDWRPKVSLKEGLNQTIDWFLKNQKYSTSCAVLKLLA